MPTLAEARLARELVMLDRVRTLKDSIIDRQEFESPIPSNFAVVLGFIVNGRPDETFTISVAVLSHVQAPIFSAGPEQHQVGPRGTLEVYLPFQIPVLDVGPCYILLKFNNTEVWRQRIFFSRAGKSR